LAQPGAGVGPATGSELIKVARLDLATLSDTFALEGILGSQLILVDEVECDRWKEGTFKTLVSGNGIAINRKHLSVLNYQSRAKWIISSNAPPYFRDKSGGVARRLSIVEWANVIPEHERIPDFSKKLLEEEGRLFLDWMLEGARRVVAPVVRQQQRGRGCPHRSRPWLGQTRLDALQGSYRPSA